MPSHTPPPILPSSAAEVPSPITSSSPLDPSGQYSNAALDGDSILDVIQATPLQNFVLISSSSAASSTGFRALYKFDLDWDDGSSDSIFLEVYQCLTQDGAEKGMKAKLDGFQIDPDKATTRLKEPLGSDARQSLNNIFWVRGSIFLDLACDNPSKPNFIESITTIAFALDGYLAKTLVDPGLLLKPPPPQTNSSSYNAESGSLFSINTVNPAADIELHPLRPAEVADPTITVPVANGGSDGAYKFLARNVGSTTVKIIIASAVTLAVAFTEVTVNVVNATKTDEQLRAEIVDGVSNLS